MSFEHIDDRTMTLGVAFVLAFLGAVEIAWPGCFSGIRPYFRRAEAWLAPPDRDRLERVMAARCDAEGSDVFTRYTGFFTLGMAALALLPGIPYAVPYAAACLAIAISTLSAYLRLHRATQRRAAPLVRRRIWDALPPFALACAVICIVEAAVFAGLPPYRLGASAAIVAGLALCAIAWRIATAPALLFGEDPQVEYIVDERVRLCRATGLISLACATAYTASFLGGPPIRDPTLFLVAVKLTGAVAFIVVMLIVAIQLRKPLPR